MIREGMRVLEVSYQKRYTDGAGFENKKYYYWTDNKDIKKGDVIGIEPNNYKTPEDKLKFKPSCMSINEQGYKNELVFTYINDEQGLYEVGEVSKGNCKNAYPYAMALKRCFDRVVLKKSKLACSGSSTSTSIE